ncbi:UDP-N-acetylmuramoyl-L-alanyl-D-glutamate--2,6-diaminopimelate ligase [Candidatus Peregrinibacteria bacterium]|nr:UDP-N-acetylmuramoyl-L-alanyl-D-glutamate--2,6-diaminopimelate ligase [Candidatus Peregrinibacteria bacterium]
MTIRTFLRKILGPTHPLRMMWYKAKGIVAAILYNFPARYLFSIGVTGTNGKTTTVHFIESILRSAGKKVAMVSTVEFKIDGRSEPNDSKLTTMSPFQTQKFLKRCLKERIETVVIECSSHAIHQGRLFGIDFNVAALTNITHEHLDYHRTMEEYKNAKKLLFDSVSKVVHKRRLSTGEPWLSDGEIILNAEDQYFNDFMSIQAPKKISYGLAHGDIQAAEISHQKEGINFTLIYEKNREPIFLHRPGTFNVQNALTATGVGLACGLSIPEIKKGLEALQFVPGRQEFFKSSRGFEVVVDFALTPDALEKLYDNLRKMGHKRIIGIIGSCGDRDKEKRPLMGRIVAEKTDLTIVTDEEPYTEDPKVIMEAVMKGARESAKKEGENLFLIEDRYAAIEFAVQKAIHGDLIVVTGMGAFTTRTMNSGSIPWDEREVVKEIIAKNE